MSKPEGLLRLVEEGIIDAVHSRLMSGKEATVYVVERAGTLGAAKVYKSRQDRTFKKVASYTEGRNQTRNSRDRRAMDKKTSYGRELMEEGWQDMEFRALRAAFDAGVRVPEPFFLYEDILFMELVVDSDGAPASRLADFPFTPEEATALHLEVFMQVKKLLETGRVHGDLSAYNVLMADKGPTIIDMPQVVDVSGNANAGQILRRDLRNVTEHLARFDARLLRFADCGEALFRHFSNGTMDLVTGPEVVAPQQLRGGRRQRDAERGRAGRDKAPRPAGPEIAYRAPSGADEPRGPRGHVAHGAQQGPGPRIERQGGGRGNGRGEPAPDASERFQGGPQHGGSRGGGRPEPGAHGPAGAHGGPRGGRDTHGGAAPRGRGPDPRGAPVEGGGRSDARGPMRTEGGVRPDARGPGGGERPERFERGERVERPGRPDAGGRETREVVRDAREPNVMRAQPPHDPRAGYAPRPADRADDRGRELGGTRGPAPVARRDERGPEARGGLGSRGHDDDAARRRR